MIFELIGWACLAHIAVDFLSYLDEDDMIYEKPFKCDLCMGYWLSVLPLVVGYGSYGFLYAGIVGVLADLIFRLKQRL